MRAWGHVKEGHEGRMPGAPPAVVGAGGECAGRWDLPLEGMTAGARSTENSVGGPESCGGRSSETSIWVRVKHKMDP